MTLSPQSALVAGLGIYLTWRGDLTNIIWLSLATADTFRALRTIHPNGRRVGIATRRRAMKDALISWIVSALISQVEPILSSLLGWLPFYTPLRWILSLGFLAIRKSACMAIYTSLISPLFKSYEIPIDLLLLLLHSISAIIIYFTLTLPSHYLSNIYTRMKSFISFRRASTLGDQSNPFDLVDDSGDDGAQIISAGDISLSTPNIPGRLLRSTRKKAGLAVPVSRGEMGESSTRRVNESGRSKVSYGYKDIVMSPSLPPSPTISLLPLRAIEEDMGTATKYHATGGENAQAGPSRPKRHIEEVSHTNTKGQETINTSTEFSSRRRIREPIHNINEPLRRTTRPLPLPAHSLLRAEPGNLYPSLPDQFIIPNPTNPSISTKSTTRSRPIDPVRHNPPIRSKPPLQKSSISTRPTSTSTSRLIPIPGSGLHVRLDPSGAAANTTSIPGPKRDSASSPDSAQTDRSVLSETETRDKNRRIKDDTKGISEEDKNGKVDKGKGKAVVIGEKRSVPEGWTSEVKGKRTRREIDESVIPPTKRKVDIGGRERESQPKRKIVTSRLKEGDDEKITTIRPVRKKITR